MENNSIDEVGDRQHVNPDGETDALKGARAAGIGSAIAGGVAGSVIGPMGTLTGAVIGAVAGTIAGGLGVGAVDKVDNDSTTDHTEEWSDSDSLVRPLDLADMPERRFDRDAPISPESRHDLAPLTPYYNLTDQAGSNDTPGIQTGGHAVDGTPDTRGISEKAADALTGDTIDDKTGKRIA